jgi:hypothetical protein
MGEFIDITVLESIAERMHTVGWESVTDAERELFCVYLLQYHLLHEGVRAALDKLSRDELNNALGGLRRIGAEQAASLMTSVMEGVSDERLEQIDSGFAHSEIAAIGPTTFPDKYVQANPGEFLGPRTLVELWESMQRRGATEKPKRLVEMERHAATDAPFTDQRCGTCGQPVPKHKSKCRRCGRPYTAVRPVA